MVWFLFNRILIPGDKFRDSLKRYNYDNECLAEVNQIDVEINNIFQSYEWGELKRYSSWTPVRIQILDNSQTRLAAQILVKNILGKKVAWCPGGPLINAKNPNEGISILEKFKNLEVFNYIILK